MQAACIAVTKALYSSTADNMISECIPNSNADTQATSELCEDMCTWRRGHVHNEDRVDKNVTTNHKSTNTGRNESGMKCTGETQGQETTRNVSNSEHTKSRVKTIQEKSAPDIGMDIRR